VKRNLLILSLVAGAVVAFPGCKSDSPMLAVAVPTKEDLNKAADKLTGGMAGQVGIAGKPGAVPQTGDVGIRKYFFNYLHQPIEAKINVFQSNMAGFTPTVEIEADVEVAESGPITPLQYYDSDSYKLVLIMSGTAMPKALVSDPQGKSYIIMVDTPIGNRNGRVVSITGNEVRIDEPGFPAVVKSLGNDREDMLKELQSVQEF
jgi:hypothetical protein